MSEQSVKLRIDLEPEMNEEKQQKVLNQVTQIGEQYSKVVSGIIMDGLTDETKEDRAAALSSISGLSGSDNNDITNAVRNLGHVFNGVTQNVASQLKTVFDEPVAILQRQMDYIARAYNATTDWSNKTINQVVGAQAYAMDYAKRINQMSSQLLVNNGNGTFRRRNIGTVDNSFFEHFEEIKDAYLTGIEELQHKRALPRDADTISNTIYKAEQSKIYRTSLNKILGNISDAEAKEYTRFMTAAALPFFYTNDTEGRRANYIKRPDSVTPYGHLPDLYRKIYEQASNHNQDFVLPTVKASRVQKESMVDKALFSEIQKMAEEDKTGVITELAISAGLVDKQGHKLTWRNAGSDAQVGHFAALLPVELEKLKRGSLQYREDPLETDRWNRRSVVVDRAISRMSELGVRPQLIENPYEASTAPFTGKEATLKALGFPKSYIIPKTTIDNQGNLVYRTPTPEEIRVPKGQKAGVETKNQKFVSVNDSGLMRMLRQTAQSLGYTLDEELGSYTNKEGTQIPLMTKVPLSELWESAREANGWFPEGGYEAINDRTKKEINRFAQMVDAKQGIKYGSTPFRYGFLNEEDMFFVPAELREAYEKAANAAGVVSAFEGGNARGLMNLKSREALVKQINNVKSFNTPSHGEEEFYSIRTSADRRTGVNPEYINWTALAKIYEMKTGDKMDKENILDSLAFVRPGGLFDEGFQGRGAGPVLKFAGVLGDIPATLAKSGIMGAGFGQHGQFRVPSAAIDPENKQEIVDLYRYYYGDASKMHLPAGWKKEDIEKLNTGFMDDREREAFQKRWTINAADDNVDIWFADTSVKDAEGSKFLPVEKYRTQIINSLLRQKNNKGKQLYTQQQAEAQADKQISLKQDEGMIDNGFVRLYADEFKRNMDTSIDFHGGLGVVREAGAFETHKSYMPVSMAQSLNLPYSAYAKSIENYQKQLANWKDPAWVQRHGFENMPEYQREMENDPSFMDRNEGARSYIQKQIADIREHMRKGELALTTPGYSAIAGMTTGMALDFLTKLTGNNVDPNSDVAPLFKSALLEMYDYDSLIKNAKTEDERKSLQSKESEYREIYDEIKNNKYFIAPGLKRDDSYGFYKAVAERYPAAMGTAVAGRNLYYNPDGSVNQRIAQALTASGASKDVFYVPSEAMYKMNTGDFDGDTVWAYVSQADEWLKGVEEVDTRLSKSKELLAARKKQQEENMPKELKEAIQGTFGEEVVRASFLGTYAKGAMGLGSAVIRNALQMPEGVEKDAALLEGMEYYDLATSEIKKKGVTNAKLGKAGFNALLVGQNFDRLMRNVYAFSNAEEDTRADMNFPSIFKSNIGSVNDMSSIGTISMNQSTARAAGGTFALRKKMSDYIKNSYDMGTALGQGAEWYSKIRIGDLTGEHFVTPEDIAEGYDWLTKIRSEQAKRSTSEQIVWEQQAKALESALKFMESDMSTSQKNIDREIFAGTKADGSKTERAKALSMINANKRSSASDLVYEVLALEQQKEIENQKAVAELQKDERFKAIQDSFKYNPNDPNNPQASRSGKAFPRRYSVTATESWFDRNALPGAGDRILEADEFLLEPGAQFKSGSNRRRVNLKFDNESSFGNYERRVETQANEIMGDSDSIDMALGDYMHKAFENFWNEQVGYVSDRERSNKEHAKNGESDPYLTQQTGYTSNEIKNFAYQIQEEFSKLLSGDKSLDGTDGTTFQKRLDTLGFELYKDDQNNVYQVKPKSNFARSSAEQTKMEDSAARVNEKLRSMQDFKLGGDSGQIIEGSLGNLVQYLYGHAGSLRVVGTEGKIFDKNRKEIYNEKDEATQYSLSDGTQVSTHAKPDAVFEIDGKYYILDYKSRRAGASDSVFQSMLYQKQYERRAEEALRKNDLNNPFAQFGYLDENNQFVSKFGGVLGFDAKGKSLLQYSQAHNDWRGKDFIDALEEQYIAAIGRKKDDLENKHYAAGQLELIRRQDRELVQYAQENGLLPSDISHASSKVQDAQKDYYRRRDESGYEKMSSAETDFYIARFAQDKQQLDEIEKALGSERSRLWRKNNPFGSSYDRFGGLEDQINSLLGDDTLSKMIEVYNDSEDIQGDIRKQIARKTNALSLLTNVRSEYAVEDVKDARKQIMASLYGVDYDKGGQGLVGLWQQINKARSTKEGLLKNPDIYDETNGVFRTTDDTKENPEKYKNAPQIARDAERTRAELASNAEEKYNEATREYNDLLALVKNIGLNKIVSRDKEEGVAQLREIIGKPLDLKSVDKFFKEKVDSLIGYVEQRQANIDKLQKMLSSPGFDMERANATAQEIADNIAQRDEAAQYLKNPYKLVEVIDKKTGINGSENTPRNKISRLYEEQKRSADIKLALAKEDVETLTQLGMSDDDLVKLGLKRASIEKDNIEQKKGSVVRFSPYDNDIVSLRQKGRTQKLSDEEQERLTELINRRRTFFLSTGVAIPTLPLETNQYALSQTSESDMVPLTQKQIEEKAEREKEEARERQERENRIKENTAKEQLRHQTTMKYWDLWKSQNENYLSGEERAQELSMQSLIGRGDTNEIYRLSRLQQARSLRERIAEQKDENGEYRYSEPERNRIRTLLSDPALESYIDEEIKRSEAENKARLSYEDYAIQQRNALSLRQMDYSAQDYRRQQNRRYSRSRIAQGLYSLQDRSRGLSRQIEGWETSRNIAEEQQKIYDLRVDQYKAAHKNTDLTKDTTYQQLLHDQSKGLSQIKQYTDQIKKAENEIAGLSSIGAKASAVMQSLSSSLGMVAARLGRQFFRKALQEAKKFIQEYDKSMTEIQMITLKSNDEINVLGKNLIQTALDNRSTVSETTSAAASLYRQGLSDEEVDTRLEDVLKFSKVAGIKTEEASKIITTALQNDLVENSSEAMDALVALGDTAATTASEIAKGMQKSAASAKQAGMSYGELVTLLTIGTSKTQLGGASIGSALQTMIYRLYKVNKNEDFYDENGNHVAATDATKALERMGISLFDESGNFRGPYQILQDVASGWENADDVTQSAILSTLGAGRQRSNVATFLQGLAQDNGEIAGRYLNTAETSQGITDRKYLEYLDSLEAAQNNVKTSFDQLIETFNLGGQGSGFLNYIAELIQGLTQAEQSTGALSTAIKTLGVGFVGLMAASHPFIAIAAAVVAAVGAFGNSQKKTDISTQEKFLQDRYQNIAEGTQETDQVIEETKALIEKKNSKEGLTSDESEKLQGNLDVLSSKFVGITGSVNGLTGSYDALISKMKEYQQENDKIKQGNTRNVIQGAMTAAQTSFVSNYNAINATRLTNDSLADFDSGTVLPLSYYFKNPADFAKVMNRNTDQLDDMAATAFNALNDIPLIGSWLNAGPLSWMSGGKNGSTVDGILSDYGTLKYNSNAIENLIQQMYKNGILQSEAPWYNVVQTSKSPESALNELIYGTGTTFQQNDRDRFYVDLGNAYQAALDNNLNISDEAYEEDINRQLQASVKTFAENWIRTAVSSVSDNTDLADHIVGTFVENVTGSEGFYTNAENAGAALYRELATFAQYIYNPDGSINLGGLTDYSLLGSSEIPSKLYSFNGANNLEYNEAYAQQAQYRADRAAEIRHNPQILRALGYNDLSDEELLAKTENVPNITKPQLDNDSLKRLVESYAEYMAISVRGNAISTDPTKSIEELDAIAENAYSLVYDELMNRFNNNYSNRKQPLNYRVLQFAKNELKYSDERIDEFRENNWGFQGETFNSQEEALKAREQYQKNLVAGLRENLDVYSELMADSISDITDDELIKKAVEAGLVDPIPEVSENVSDAVEEISKSIVSAAIDNAKQAAYNNDSTRAKYQADQMYQEIDDLGITDLQGLIDAAEEGKITNFSTMLSTLGLGDLLDQYTIEQNGKVISTDYGNAAFSQFIAALAKGSNLYSGYSSDIFSTRFQQAQNALNFINGYRDEGWQDVDFNEMQTVLGQPLASRLMARRENRNEEVTDLELLYASQLAQNYQYGINGLTEGQRLAGAQQLYNLAQVGQYGTVSGLDQGMLSAYLGGVSGLDTYTAASMALKDAGIEGGMQGLSGLKEGTQAYQDAEKALKPYYGSLKAAIQATKDLDAEIASKGTKAMNQFGEYTDDVATSVTNLAKGGRTASSELGKMRKQMSQLSNAALAVQQSAGKTGKQLSANQRNDLAAVTGEDADLIKEMSKEQIEKLRQRAQEIIDDEFVQDIGGTIQERLNQLMADNKITTDMLVDMGIDVNGELDLSDISRIAAELKDEALAELASHAGTIGQLVIELEKKGLGETAVAKLIKGNVTGTGKRTGGGGGGGGKSAADKLLEKQKFDVSAIQHDQKMLEIQEKNYDRYNDDAAYRDNINQQIQVQQRLADQYQKNIQEIENMRRSTKEGSDDWNKLTESLWAAQEAFAGVAEAVDALYAKMDAQQKQLYEYNSTLLQHKQTMSEIDYTFYMNVNDPEAALGEIDKQLIGMNDIEAEDRRRRAEIVSDMENEYLRNGESDRYRDLVGERDSLTEKIAKSVNDRMALDATRLDVQRQYQQNESIPYTHRLNMISSQMERADLNEDTESYNKLFEEQENIYKEIEDRNNQHVTQLESLRDYYNSKGQTQNALNTTQEINSLLEQNDNMLTQRDKARKDKLEKEQNDTRESLQRQTMTEEHQNNGYALMANAYKRAGNHGAYRDMLQKQISNWRKMITVQKNLLAIEVQKLKTMEKETEMYYKQLQLVQEIEGKITELEANIANAEMDIMDDYIDEILEGIERVNDLDNHIQKLIKDQQQIYQNQGNWDAYFIMAEKRRQELISSVETMSAQAEQLKAEMWSVPYGSDKWDQVRQKVLSLEESISSARVELENFDRELEGIKVDRMLDEINRHEGNRTHNITLMQYEQTRYQTNGELTNYGIMLQKEIDYREENTVAMEEELTLLREELENINLSEKDYYRLSDAIKKKEEALLQNNNAIEKNNKLLRQNEQAIRKTRLELEQMVLKVIEDNKKKQRDMLNNTVEMQNIILNVIKRRYQDEWDLEKETLDRKKDALEKEKQLINERLNYRKRMMDAENKYSELNDYQRQLALISADPTRSKESKELTRKIDELRQDIRWDEASQQAEAATERIEDEINAINEYVQIHGENLQEMLLDANNFAAEVKEVLSRSYADIVLWLQQNDIDYQNSLDERKKQLEEGWKETWMAMKGIVETYWDEINEILSSQDSFMKFMYENSLDYANASVTGQISLATDWQTAWENAASAVSVALQAIDYTPDFHEDFTPQNSEEAILEALGWDPDFSWYNNGSGYNPSFTSFDDHKNDGKEKGEEEDAKPEETQPDQSTTEQTSTNPSGYAGTGEGPINEPTVPETSVPPANTGTKQKQNNNTYATVYYSTPSGAIQSVSGSGIDYNAAREAAKNNLPRNADDYDFNKSELEKRVKDRSKTNHGYSFSINGTTYSDDGFESKNAAQNAFNVKWSSVVSSLVSTAGSSAAEQMKKNAVTNVYKEGGLVDYTGPAWVDGTKSKPEAFLSAYDTANIKALTDALNYVNIEPFRVPNLDKINTSNQTIGDINITINGAEMKDDADFEDVARRVGQEFTKQLRKEGLNLASYAF